MPPIRGSCLRRGEVRDHRPLLAPIKLPLLRCPQADGGRQFRSRVQRRGFDFRCQASAS